MWIIEAQEYPTGEWRKVCHASNEGGAQTAMAALIPTAVDNNRRLRARDPEGTIQGTFTPFTWPDDPNKIWKP